MRKKKWLLPVCIVSGVIVFCILLCIFSLHLLHSKGYMLSTGIFYMEDEAFLIGDAEYALLHLGTGKKDKRIFKNCNNGDKVLVIHDGVLTSYPGMTAAYFVLRLEKGDTDYKPTEKVYDSMEAAGHSVTH